MFRSWLFIGTFLSHVCAFAQYSLSLQVIGDDTPLIGATIETTNGHFLITDKEGKAQLTCSCESTVVLVKHLGYRTFTDTLDLNQKSVLIKMQIADQEIDEILISAESDQRKLINPTKATSFSLESISKLPFLLGVQDPVKFIQLQAGVSTGTDGNNGYFVRGGGIDQNAIYLDNMELYNANHLLGFFSMFNKNAISRVDFVKSGYPAYLGGRLSSMMNLYTATPDLTKPKGDFNLGLLAIDGTISAPIVKEKLGLMISYRRSYIDLITQNLFDPESQIRKRTDYRFSDLVSKLHLQTSQKSSLSLTLFTGRDQNTNETSSTFSNELEWKTLNAGLNWKWLINEQSDLQIFANTGTYEQSFGGKVSSFTLDLNSFIKSQTAGFSFAKNYKGHEVVVGGKWQKRLFQPNQADVSIGRGINTLETAQLINTQEWALYADDWISVNKRLHLGIGVRLSGFNQLGPFTRYLADDNFEIVDSTAYAKNEIVNSYIGLEPRMRLSYLLNDKSSLRFSFDKTFQYIHLSPLSSVSLPTDLWIPSTSIVKPQSAHQLSLGYTKIINSSNLSVTIDGFGKLLSNQVEWKNGAIAGYTDSPNFDDDLIFGKGHSYGIEFTLIKERGTIEGNLNYTWSRTFRQFVAVNSGNIFPAKYDRIHDLNLTASFHRTNWTFSGLFKLASGTALTLPVAKYLIEERVISEYSSRNSLRMPIYHRMDISATWTPPGNKRASWVFSVYNIYNRKNPYFVYFDVQGNVENYSLDIDLNEVPLFPVLPSISYAFSF
jgi:hypothetical protein